MDGDPARGARRAATCWAKRGRWRGWAPSCAIRARRPSLLAEAAGAYERAGRVDDAITALAKCVELRPNDSTAYMRAYQLLRADLDAPGRAVLFDALLSHRLVQIARDAAELDAHAATAVAARHVCLHLGGLRRRQLPVQELHQFFGGQRMFTGHESPWVTLATASVTGAGNREDP